MISREDAYKKAFLIKETSLKEKNDIRYRQIASFSDANPRIGEINRRLSAIGAEIAITALSGDLEKLARLQYETTNLSEEKTEICQSAGIADIVYDCPACNDTGYVHGKICSCIHNLVKQIRMQDLAREFPVDECRFENFDLNYYPAEDSNGAAPRKKMTQLLKLCREYTIGFDPKFSPNLLFMGNAGLGKTHLSLAIVYELTQKGFDVIYGSAYNLFSAMENEHFTAKSQDSYNAAINCDLLVIDDLGSEFITPYIKTLLYNIVNTRLLSKKPMIINTNLSMAEIENLYTPRIASRLIGSFTAKKFTGRDIRQLKAMEKFGS